MSRVSSHNSAKSTWVVTFNEPIFYGRLFAELIKSQPGSFDGVILLPYSKGTISFLKETLYRLRFYGWAAMCKISLKRIGMSLQLGNVEKVARENGLKINKVTTQEEILAHLESEGARLCLAALPFRVSKTALNAIPEGWINVHCGPLPQYAGRDAPFWCLLHREKHLTVTVHYMAEDFDTGPIIEQAYVENDGSPYFLLVEKLFDKAGSILARRIKTGYPKFSEATPQDYSKATYFPLPPAALGKQFRNQGGRFI